MKGTIINLIDPIFNDLRQFLFPNEVCTAINIMILFLLFLTILISLYTISRYKRSERAALRIVESKVGEKIDFLRVPMETKNEEEQKDEKSEEESVEEMNEKQEEIPDLLMEISELQEGIKKRSIMFKRLDMIERMRKFRVKISAEFLQQATETAEASRLGNTLPGFSTNLAMILGLFGTFIGLALMVTKISMLMPTATPTAFSISSLQSSIAGMETVFKGIKTAFSTSITGIFATIVCLYLSFRIRRKKTAFFLDLDTFTIEKLIPVTVPLVQGEHPLENIAFQLQDSFDNMELIIAQNKDTIENLDTIQESFKTIVGDVRDITKREASRNFEGVLSLLTKTNDSLTGVVQKWPESVEAMKEYTKVASKKIDSLIGVMKEQQEVFDKGLNRIMTVKQGKVFVIFPSLRDKRHVYILVSTIICLIILMVAC